MRQTGRTSRIVNFAVNELFSVGGVIVTDHIAFEGFKMSNKHLDFLDERIRDRVNRETYGTHTTKSTIHRIPGTDLKVLEIKMKKIEKNG